MSMDVEDAVALLDRIMRSEDPISAVLRLHLWVEQDLNELLHIGSGCDWSKKICGRQFDYFDKVRIAVAFGLVDEDLIPPLQDIGEIRNDLAHKLAFTLSVERQEKFCRHFPRKQVEHRAALFFSDTRPATGSEAEDDASNVRYLEGLEGRRALTPTFLAAVFTLVSALENAALDLKD